MPVKITITDSCKVGDPIGYDALDSDVWEKAKANSKVYANLIAGEAGASGDTITCYREAVIDGFTGAVAGDLVYLGDTAGTYVAAPAGLYQQCVGMCISTTEAVIRPDAMPMLAHSIQTTPTGLGCAGLFRTEVSAGVAGTACCALKVEAKSISGATVSALRGMYMILQQDHGNASYDCVGIRIENVGSNKPGAFFEVVGDAGAFLQIQGINTTCISKGSGGSANSGNGWMKVIFGAGTFTRYIPLYETIT